MAKWRNQCRFPYSHEFAEQLMSESPEHGVPTRLARPMAEIREALKDVIDPELGVNIIDLGLVYGLRFSERGVLEIDMTLTTAE